MPEKMSTQFRVRNLNSPETSNFVKYRRKKYKDLIKWLDKDGVSFRVETSYDGNIATKSLTILKRGG